MICCITPITYVLSHSYLLAWQILTLQTLLYSSNSRSHPTRGHNLEVQPATSLCGREGG